jgi:hypothetical protein
LTEVARAAPSPAEVAANQANLEVADRIAKARAELQGPGRSAAPRAGAVQHVEPPAGSPAGAALHAHSSPTSGEDTASFEAAAPRLAEVVEKLAELLGRLEVVLERLADRPGLEPLTVRIDQVARLLGVSRRIIERERAAGRFPAADLRVGKLPLWRVSTVRAFVESERGRA